MDNLTPGLIGEALGRLFYILPRHPTQVQIEITNRCNLDCLMCPRKILGIPLEHMPFERFEGIIDRLEGVKKVTLTGWGEPFLHPQIYSMIALCKSKGFYTQLTTNGTLVEPARIIDSGLDAITFSIDSIKGDETPGHLNQEVLKKVEELAGLRKGGRPLITLQAILHKGRVQDILDVVVFGASAGVDRINLGRLDPRFKPVARPSPEEERYMFREADRLGRRLGIQVDIIQYAISRGAKRLIYRLIKGALHRFGRYCLKTYNYLYVNIQGEVTPCCILPNHAVGDLAKEGLGEIWRGERFRDFRQNMEKVCGRCDLWKICYIEQEVEP